MSNRSLRAARAGLALIALALPALPAPAQADGVRTTSCVGGPRSFNCVTIRRGEVADPHSAPVPQPLSQQEIAAAQERDRLWQARCRPLVSHDEYGVPRYRYAARGCEYGTYE